MELLGAGGSHSVTPKCMYVRTPSGGTMSDTEEQSCLRTLVPDTVRDYRCKERLKVGIKKSEGRNKGPISNILEKEAEYQPKEMK